MSIPQPPDDLETRNIIEKLASFVARNGPEFEAAAKQKHENNPKFAFLRGGEYQHYYTFRVQAEKALLQQPPNPFHLPPPPNVLPPSSMTGHQASRPTLPPFPGTLPPPPGTNGPPPPWTQTPPSHLFPSGPPPPPAMPIPPIPPPALVIEQAFQQQIQSLQERLRQSEINLAAQRESMQMNKKTKVDENIRAARQARIVAQATESNIDLNELDRIMSFLIEACTKDNITLGRNSVFNYSQTSLQIQTICLYLIDRILSPESIGDARLHLIYLINDILHNCIRKGNDELRFELSKIIIPIFCWTLEQSNDDHKQKLVKLLDLWDKNKYFNGDIMEKLRDISQAKRHFEDAIRIEYAPIIEATEVNLDEKYNQLERQHADFAVHIQTQISQIQQQILQFHQVQQQTPPLPLPPPPPHLLNNTFGPSLPPNMLPRMPPPSPQSNNSNQSQPPPLMSLNPFTENSRDNPNHRSSSSNVYDNLPPSLMSMSASHYDNNNSNQYDDYRSSQMEPTFDLHTVTDEIPYFDLPAGLMCLLVKDEDCDYHALDPSKIHLPPSELITDRLMNAVENFYKPPTHETPRNAEGWERLGLFEYYKTKNTYKYSKERIQRLPTGNNDEEKYSNNKDKRTKNDRSRSKSSSSRSSSRSSSSSSSSSSASSSSSSSASSKTHSNSSQTRKRSRSRSRTPTYNKQYSSKNLPSTRSRSRSPTPPSFSSSYTSHVQQQTRLTDSNVGHKLLQKMGWQGSGLGRREQGIVEPIMASTSVNNESKSDQYKGIGHEEDPFEQFRRQKAKGYVNRLIAAQAETAARRQELETDDPSTDRSMGKKHK